MAACKYPSIIGVPRITCRVTSSKRKILKARAALESRPARPASAIAGGDALTARWAHAGSVVLKVSPAEVAAVANPAACRRRVSDSLRAAT
ncbi:hypothetical protein GCM10020220_005240 [Nonomuraea rubra]